MPELTGGEAVYETLRALGVDHVFGIVSVHNIPMYDAILRGGGITPISVRHEQGALHAADGYARATGKLGVAIVSTGPGTTNSMTGLFEAAFASSRVLMITGQIDSTYYGKGKGFLHEAENQLAMLRTVVGQAESVRRTEEISETLLRVASGVMTGRPRPGALEIPVDFQYARSAVEIPVIEGWPRTRPPADALEKAAALLNAARRPIIWAGGGVITADASELLTQLAETLNAPVFTSATGRGAIAEDHPLAMGPLPQQPQFTPTIEAADVVLAVGTRFQAGSTRNWAVKIPGKLIHLDADPSVIGRNYAPEAAVIGDASVGLAALLRAVTQTPRDADFVTAARGIRDKVRETIRAQIGPDYAAIMDSMRELLPRDGCIVRDATVPAYLWGNRIIPILAPRTSLHSTSAAIGPGLPLAIGAAIGSGKKTALIQGDGGFMLNIGELATAVQHNVPVIVCVFNDRGYGVLRSIQANTFEGRQTGVELVTPDFVMVARGMGMHGEPVGSAEEFRDAFRRAVAANGPVLLDIDMAKLVPMSGLGAPPPPRPVERR
jgi:acetolactate synthase I/II/III large subunit